MNAFVSLAIFVLSFTWFVKRNKKKRQELGEDEAALTKFLMRDDPISRIQVATIIASATGVAVNFVRWVYQ